MLSSLSSVPPVWPRPRPAIIGTNPPQAATSGARMRLTLSPTPPVECLSRTGPGKPRDAQSSTVPDRAIASVKAAVSRRVMPRKNTAIAKAAACPSPIEPSARPRMKAAMAAASSSPPSRFTRMISCGRSEGAAGGLPASPMEGMGGDLDGAVELRIGAGGILRRERHLDRGGDADAFEPHAIDPHVLDRQFEEAAVAQHEGRRRQNVALGARTDDGAETVFLEAVGQHLLAAARTAIDEEHDGLAPAGIDDLGLAVSARHRHLRRARVENVEIGGLRPSPTVAQVPDQGVGILELARRDLRLERVLIAPPRIGPHADVADLAALLFDDADARIDRLLIGLVGADADRRHGDLLRRPVGRTPNGQRHRLPLATGERAHFAEGGAVGGDDLVPRLQPGCRGRKSVEKADDENLVVRLPREDTDALIGDLALGEHSRQLVPQCARENVGQIVISAVLARVEADVRGAELGEHAIDDLGTRALGAGGKGKRPVAGADRRPVAAIEMRVVEFLVRKAPNLIEQRGGGAGR